MNVHPNSFILVIALTLEAFVAVPAAPATGGALADHRYRVLISTDIGGTDPDDFQSMVHLLVYADVLDIEGLISSPYGPGRKEHIQEVIDCYARDYANLRTYSDRYPTPDALRAITKQGESDRMEVFGVLEIALPLGQGAPQQPEAFLLVDNQSLPGYAAEDETVRFRFCPKAAQTYEFQIRSNVPALDGQASGITAVLPPPDAAQHPTDTLPNWWTDDPSPEFAEGPHIGARTVSRWRADFLRDFASRMLRCQSPASTQTAK